MNVALDTSFVDAVRTKQRISGLSHGYYRYPARFSPFFARAAIETFTKPGDVVYDPFMGGGTTLVEAMTLGRRAVGTDINSLSVFIAKVKTTPLANNDVEDVGAWIEMLSSQLNVHQPAQRDTVWMERGYHKNISSRTTWPIRKLLEISLGHLDMLSNEQQRQFARCVLLRTSQWALDCRREIPSASKFRRQLMVSFKEMREGATEFEAAMSKLVGGKKAQALCLHSSAAEIAENEMFKSLPKPRLIVTSPPYPGVHVLYHRWQVQGRRETPAPYWIADSLDGDGASFYNFGGRKTPGLKTYYEAASNAFTSIAKIVDRQTTVVQMIAFNDPSWQLPEYLLTMKGAGFTEIQFPEISDSDDKRLWRDIPNRKFYADQKGGTNSSREVVLFHRLTEEAN